VQEAAEKKQAEGETNLGEAGSDSVQAEGRLQGDQGPKPNT
jgi:hypothetical protein